MRPGRRQTGMKIETVNMFTCMRPVQKSQNFNLFPLPGKFRFYMAFVSMCCSNVKVTAETSLNSCRSDSVYRPRLHETGRKSNRDHFVLVIVLFIIDVYMRPG